MTIFKIEWQNNKKNLLAWTLVLILIIGLFMSVFPSMANSDMKEMLTTKLDSLPENMLKAFHLNSGPSLIEVTGFFAYIFQYLFIAASIYAVMLGHKMLVKEEIEGTIEFLYAQPVSRRQIVLEKIAASISMLLSFWLITYLVSLGVSIFFNQGDLAIKTIFTGLSKIFVTEFFALILFLSLGFLLSSLLKQMNQGISMGLVFAFYLCGIVGDLEDKLSLLKEVSPMAQAGPALLLENDWNIILIGSLAIISLLTFILALVIYERKDLEI